MKGERPVLLAAAPPQNQGQSGRSWGQRRSLCRNPRKFGLTGCQILIQAVYPFGVAADDLGLFLPGTVRQNVIENLEAPWEGRL